MQFLHFAAITMSLTTTLCADWNTGESSGRVNIGSHELWMSLHGPDRQPGKPLVIIIPGLASSTTGWAAVQRGLTPFVRVLQYERSGYGDSESSPRAPTSVNIAQELDLLLKSARLLPPYILVAHSWGGVLSREFLALRPEDVSGMVFVDANQERTLEVLDWRELAMSKRLDGVDPVQATGLLDRHKLTNEEWTIYQNEQNTKEHKKQAELEFAEYPKSFAVLKAKSQLHRKTPLLENRPVCVVKGDNKANFEMLLAAGLAKGNGDEVASRRFREVLKTWDEKDISLQSEIRLLSSKSRFVEVKNNGHDVHLLKPQAIVDGVKWVLSCREH